MSAPRPWPEPWLIKCHSIPPERRGPVDLRLAGVRETRPAAVVVVDHWFWCDHRLYSVQRFEDRAVPLAKLKRPERALLVDLFDLQRQWATVGFVHGDLSPSNLLVTPDGTLLAVDWLPDLRCFSGTPAFASPLVAKTGLHSLETDGHGFQRLAQWLSARGRPGNNG